MRKRKIKSSELRNKELIHAIKESQKDPKFIKEVNKFIKASNSIYNLD